MISTQSLVILATSVLALAVAAQPSTQAGAQPTDSVLKFFMAAGGSQYNVGPVGSIVGVDQDARTTVVISCPTNTPIDDCNIVRPITEIQNSATAILSMTFPPRPIPSLDAERPAVTVIHECSLEGTTKANCKVSSVMTLPTNAPASLSAIFPATSTTTNVYSGTDVSSRFVGVTITAGAEKLAHPTSGTDGATKQTGAGAQLKVGGLAISGALAAVLML